MQTKSISPDSGSNGKADRAQTAAIAGAQTLLSGVPREVRNFIADVEDLITSMTSLTGEDLARAKSELTQRASAAKASLDQVGAALTDRARNTVKVTNDYVHDEPWKAIGAGAAIGFLLGLVLARRA